MKLHPYIGFKGNCEEAMQFYKTILNGNITMQSRFKEAPEGVMQVPEEAKDLIMHCTLEFDGNIIMGSDTLMEHVTFGNNFSLSINTTEEKAQAYFEKLSEGGQVLMPFGDAFWGGKFGMLSDKFGVQWMLSSEH